MAGKPKNMQDGPTARPQSLKGGEFRREADKVNNRKEREPSLEDADWADLPPRLKEKRQRG